MSRRSPKPAGCASTRKGRQAVQAALGAARGDHASWRTCAEGPDAERVIRDLARHRPQAHLHAQLRLHGADAEGGEGVPGREVRVHHRLQDRAQRRRGQRALLRRPLSGRHRGRPHDARRNVAGYVAGFPIPEVLQGINAFTLGMRSVNPQAQVKVVWLNAWFDPPQGARGRDGADEPGRGRAGLPHRVHRRDGGGAGARQARRRLPLRHAQGRRRMRSCSPSRTSGATTTRGARRRCWTAAGRAATCGAA